MYKSEMVKILNNFEDILIFDELVSVLNVGINTTYNLLQTKKIFSKKIGREYKIPKLCVIDYLFNTNTDKSIMFEKYDDILDFCEVRKLLRYPAKSTLYKILKNKEIYSKKIGKDYKIPKISLIEYILNNYSSAL